MENLAVQTSRAVQRIATNYTANAGSFAIGAFIGLLVLAFVTHGTDYTLASLTGVIALVGGAAVTGLLDKTKGGSSAVSWYLIGVAIGAVVYILLAVGHLDDDVFPFKPTPTASPQAS